jgi:hypothetical protein
MKTKLSKILGIGLTLALLTSMLLTAAPVMANVSEPTVSLSTGDDIISETATYTIAFRINNACETGDDIVIRFPEDTDIGTAAAPKAAVADDGGVSVTSGIGSGAGDVADVTVTVDDDDMTVTIDLTTITGGTNNIGATSIGAQAFIQVAITGVVNPTDPGTYTLEVKTSDESTYVESEAYDIDAPTLGGGVYVYNDAGIQMNFYGGSTALVQAVDAGYFAKDDFTVTVGPGTYLLTKDITITGDDFTLNSSDGYAETEIDCNELYGILINSGTAGDTTIDGLYLVDADVGITVSGDDTIITNCKIKDADGPGPGILINTGGTNCTISDCIFDDCRTAAISFRTWSLPT